MQGLGFSLCFILMSAKGILEGSCSGFNRFLHQPTGKFHLGEATRQEIKICRYLGINNPLKIAGFRRFLPSLPSPGGRLLLLGLRGPRQAPQPGRAARGRRRMAAVARGSPRPPGPCQGWGSPGSFRGAQPCMKGLRAGLRGPVEVSLLLG